MSDASFIDTQPPGSHIDPEVSLSGYTYERLLEYWTMIYTLGLLGGVAGTEAEQTAARDAIYKVLGDVAESAVGYIEAANIAVDDWTPPGIGAIGEVGSLGRMHVRRGIEGLLGFDTDDNDARITDQEKRIRDSIAVDLNQAARISSTGKAVVGAIANNTPLPDYAPDTSGEEGIIAATQGTVDRRSAQVNKAINDIWTAIKDVALSRYNRFMEEWDQHGLGYAYGTLAIDGAFLAVEVAISAAAGAVTGGVGAVALKVAVDVGRRVTKAATRRMIKVIFVNANRLDGKTGEFNVPKSSVDELAKSKNGYGDDLAGNRDSSHTNERDPGGPDDNDQRLDPDDNDKQDVDEDGNYRDPKDPNGVRRAPDGEAMVEENGEWTRISETSNNTKGRFGEMMADDWAAKQDPPWTKINGSNNTMDTPGHQGLDSIYQNPSPPPDYFVTDAKYGSAGLGRLKDGTQQMSPQWIKDRLGRELSRADASRVGRSHEAGLLRVDKDGNVSWESLANKAWRDEDK